MKFESALRKFSRVVSSLLKILFKCKVFPLSFWKPFLDVEFRKFIQKSQGFMPQPDYYLISDTETTI